MQERQQTLSRLVSLLPKANCGECGFGNCGRFALAVIEGRASPFGCRRDRAIGHQISKLLGLETTGKDLQPVAVEEEASNQKGLAVAPGHATFRHMGRHRSGHGGYHHRRLFEHHTREKHKGKRHH